MIGISAGAVSTSGFSGELFLEGVVIKPHLFKFNFPLAEANTGLAAPPVEVEMSSVEDLFSPRGDVGNKILATPLLGGEGAIPPPT